MLHKIDTVIVGGGQAGLAADFPAQRAKAPGTAPEHPHDQHRPFIGDPRQQAADEDATGGFHLVIWCLQGASLFALRTIGNVVSFGNQLILVLRRRTVE
jgi:hypothetical protein